MAGNKPDVVPIRRIVTGHGSGNVAKVLLDGPPGNVKYPAPGIVSTTLWTTFETPSELKLGDNVEDMGNREISLPPAANGTRFAIVDFLPGNAAFMHRTDTIDYVIVLSGELDMDMDNSTVKVKAGDVMVQRGTNHSWVNRGSVPARIAIVLVDGQSLGIGKAVPRPATR
jgi:mannose-6-phosphate isomerase-like protein (cupin superfamily)